MRGLVRNVLPSSPTRHSSSNLLPRLRRLFALFTAVAVLAGLGLSSALAPAQRTPTIVALAGLALWAVAMGRTRAPWWLDLTVIVPFALLAGVDGDWSSTYPLVHVALFQRALVGGPARVYGGAIAIAGTWLAVGVATSGQRLGGVHVVLLLGALLSTWLLRQVRLMAEQVERGVRRERRLLAATQGMAGAAAQHEVDALVARAAHDLVGQDGARTVLWEERGDAWVAIASAGPSRLDEAAKVQLPAQMVGRAARGEPWVLDADQAAALQGSYGLEPHFTGYVFVPLPRRRGPQAVLALSCPQPPDPDLTDALRRFAQEVVIAEDRAQLLSEVAEREARLDSLLQGSTDIIALLDDEGLFTLINRASLAVHGYVPEQLIGRSVFDLVHADDRGRVLRAVTSGNLTAGVQVAHRLYDARGEVRHVEANISQPPGTQGGYILNVRDITERKALEAEIVHHAHHDALTGLANRRAFTERLDEALARSERRGSPVGLILLDLDDFKPVNDTYGHQAGDEVLVEVARRLREGVRTTDVAARMGGDEFAVILEQIGHADEVSELAGRLERSLSTPISLPRGGECRVTASMGLASSGSKRDAEQLLREADDHLYVNKRARHQPPPARGPLVSEGQGPL